MIEKVLLCLHENYFTQLKCFTALLLCLVWLMEIESKMQERPTEAKHQGYLDTPFVKYGNAWLDMRAIYQKSTGCFKFFCT